MIPNPMNPTCMSVFSWCSFLFPVLLNTATARQAWLRPETVTPADVLPNDYTLFTNDVICRKCAMLMLDKTSTFEAACDGDQQAKSKE